MKKITKLLSGGLAAAIVSSALGCSNLTFKETQISTQSTTTLVSAEQSINRRTEIELSSHTSLSEIRIDKCIEQILTDEEIIGLNNQRENVCCNSILFIENNLNQYMGSIFEKMCMEYLIRLVKKGQLSFIPQHIGKWWGANPYRKNEKGYPMQDDIDILMYNKDYCLLGECKFKNENFKVEDFMILTERAKMFHQEHKIYYLFSKKGFDKKLIQIADENTHVHLITLDNLYSI